MNCEDFRRELEFAVENHVSPDLSEAREHLKHCRQCRRLCEDYDIIERAVAEWVDVDDAPDLSGRVLAVLASGQESEPPPQTAGSSSRIVSVLVGLSVVALVFLVAFFLNRNPGQNPANVAKTPSDSATEEVGGPQFEPPEPVEMDRVLSDTRAAYESLVSQMTGPFEPLQDEGASGAVKDEKTGSPGENPGNSSNSVPPQLAGLQSEVMKPLGFLTAVFSSSTPKP